MLYEDPWWRDDGGGVGTGFGILVLIVILCVWIDGEIKKNKETRNKLSDNKDAQRLKKEDDILPSPVQRMKCGTPFLEAKRLEASNDNGWKDKTGHVLTNGEVDLLRKYYFVYMTPVIHEMFEDEWAIKNDFEFIASRSVFPKKPLAESDFEVYFYYNMMMPIVQSLIPKHFTSDHGFTEKELFDIADDILGEKDHDFNYLSRTYGMRRW